MRLTFFTLFLFLGALGSLAQLPEFDSNISTKESTNSIIREKFEEKYDYIISYYYHSHWSEKHSYLIFGHDGRNWNMMKWTFKLNNKKQRINERTRKFAINNDEFESVLDYLQERHFYSFNERKLNLNSRDNGDGTITKVQVSDGGNEQIQVVSPNAHRISNAYAASSLQENFPTSDRENFIECRNKLLKLANGKY